MSQSWFGTARAVDEWLTCARRAGSRMALRLHHAMQQCRVVRVKLHQLGKSLDNMLLHNMPRKCDAVFVSCCCCSEFRDHQPDRRNHGRN